MKCLLLTLLLIAPCCAQTYLEHLIATGNLDNCAQMAGIPEPEPEPAGLFASPTGSPTGTGTFSDPMELEYALSGTAPEVVDSSTLFLLSGTYTKPFPTSGYAGKWTVAETNIIIRPYITIGYPVIINGAFDVTDSGNTIQNLYFYGDDPVPLDNRATGWPTDGEPTLAGTVPGLGEIPPVSAPTNWAEWGNVGVLVSAGGDNTTVAYNIVSGGAGSFASFTVPGVLFYGNIAYDFGWEGADRMHGHGAYARPEVGQTMTFKHNMFDNSRVMDHAGNSGNSALQIFTTSPTIGTISITENAFKDGVTIQSENSFITSLTYTDNVGESTDITTSGDTAYAGVGLGKPASADVTLVHTNNTYINISHSALENVWTTPTSTGSRIFKTKSVWDVVAKRVAEEGSFTDVSTPSTGTDESRIWFDNPTDPNRANIVIVDLDLSESVTVDPSSFLTNGDVWRLYHYRDVITPVQSGTYSTGNLTIAVIEDTPLYSSKDTIDYFILQKD
jgi:hypothetical protein